MNTGIVVRHSRTCVAQADETAKCNCSPSYRAEVYDRRAGKKIRKTFHNLSEARGWRHDAASALRKGVLRRYLAEHKLQLGWSEGLLFGRTAERPFDDSSLYARAATAWKHMNATRLANELEPIAPISLHEARHTYASLLIAAGVNAKSGTTYMGHASIQIFFDRYGHLMPGNEDEAAGLLDTYLDRVGQAWASEGQ